MGVEGCCRGAIKVLEGQILYSFQNVDNFTLIFINKTLSFTGYLESYMWQCYIQVLQKLISKNIGVPAH